MPLIEQAAGAALGGIFGIGLQKQNDKRQLEQQWKLQQQQIAGSKDLTAYNIEQQMRLWEMTNYKAQVEQLKKAGLNPALLYGMGGGGGQSSNINAGNVSGANAPTGGGEIMGGVGMGLQSAAQLQLLKAQKENIEADTANKQADLPVKGAQVPQIQADTRLKNYQSEIAQVQGSVLRQTINEQMTAWENIAAKGTQEIRNLKVDEAKKQQEINNLKSEVALNAIKGALMKAQQNNTNQDTKNKIQQILESEQKIKTMAGQLQLGWDRLIYDRKDSGEIDMNDDGWQYIKDVVPNLLIPIGRGFQGHTPVKGFR